MLGMELCRQDALKMFGLDIRFINGKNSRVYDSDGVKYIDALSQYGVMPFGHANDKIFRHCRSFFNSDNLTYLQPFTTEYVAQFKNNILDGAGNLFQHVILTTSGAESVEVAIKMVRSKTGKKKILALDSAFHGKTCAALQLTDNPEIQDYFNIKKSFSEHFSKENIDSLVERIENDKNISAVFIELVQGEGGMQALDKNKVQAIYHACKKSGVLLVVDEIQTGMGRTGTLFAYQQYGIEPDIILLAKALGGGVVPIGAVLAKDEVYPKAFDLYHSSTFAYNNFTAYVADFVLSQVNDELLSNVKDKGRYLESRLQEVIELYPDVFSHISGIGLMLGVHLKPWDFKDNYSINHVNGSGALGFIVASWLIKTCKLITMPCYSNPFCLRIQPSLNCTTEDIDFIVESISQYGRQVDSQRGYKNIFLSRNEEPRTKSKPKQLNSKKNRIVQDVDTDFIFIIHLINDATLKANLPPFYPDLNADEQDGFFKWFKELLASLTPQPHFWYEAEDISLPGINLRGGFYGLPSFPSEMLNLNKEQADFVNRKIAEVTMKSNADTLGLGAYSSIVAQGGYKLRHLNKHNINVTPGSSMTAYSAFKVWENDKALQSNGIGIIGANGDIGKFIMAMLIRYIFAGEYYDKKVILFYNPKNELAETQLIQSFIKIFRFVLGELSESKSELIQEFTRITSTPGMATQELINEVYKVSEKVLNHQLFEFYPSDDMFAIKEVDSIFLCTNFPGELDILKELNINVSIYDVSVPSNISPNIINSKNITVHQAGLFKLPSEITFGSYNICGLPPGIALGCLTETILMSAAKKLFPFKLGWQQYMRLTELEELVNRYNLQPTSIIKETTKPTSIIKETAKPISIIKETAI